MPYIAQKILHLPKQLQHSLKLLPSPLEIAAILDQVDKQSSPGIDGFPYWTYHLHASITALSTLFLEVWSSARIPSSWGCSLTRPIPKEGQDPAFVYNHHPIALTYCDGKVLTRVINKQLLPTLQTLISVTQAGFIFEQSTAHAIARVSNLLHRHPEATPLLQDIKKAYNTVSHTWLQEVLHTGGFSPNLVNIIITLNTGTTQLLVNNILSKLTIVWHQASLPHSSTCVSTPHSLNCMRRIAWQHHHPAVKWET